MASGSPFAAGQSPVSLWAIDFNGDGIQDLVTTSASSIAVLLGNGAGGFGPARILPFANSNFQSAVVGDFNRDGTPDLAIPSGANGVTVLLGEPAGGFPQTITFVAPSTVTLPASPFSLVATASSGLPVSFASTSPTICTVSGSTLTPLASGTCTVAATQAGNANYAAASPVTQSFAINAAVPQPTGGIANAASAGQATPGVVGLGTYIAIYGKLLAGSGNPSAAVLPLPTILNGSQVSLGGQPMPLLYAASGQINGLVPQGLAPNNSYPLVVTAGTVQSAPVMLLVNELQPGIYTVNTSGSGPGIVANALTAQLISSTNPAHTSDYLVIYATGLGSVRGPNGEAEPGDGVAAPSNLVYSTTAKVTATIGGVSAPVLFSGLTPTFAGLYQVNLQVPGIAPGTTVPLVLTATDSETGATSQSNTVTIVIQ